jgi:hypothetical protein
MSHSSEDDIPSVPRQPSSSKKRRVQSQRACDRCRQKKSRSFIFHSCSLRSSAFLFLSSLYVCFIFRLLAFLTFPGDGTPSISKCSHCSSSGSDCIFTESTKVCFSLANPELLVIDRSSPKDPRSPQTVQMSLSLPILGSHHVDLI